MSILAIHCNKQQETVSILKYNLKLQNWTTMFGIQLMRRDVLAFQKESLLRDLAPLRALMT